MDSTAQEQQKTFEEWLNEADKLYRDCKPLIDTCISDFNRHDENRGYAIWKDDDSRTIVSKVNAMLDLEKKFNDVMKICQAKESIDNALKKGATNRARKLESDINDLFQEATGARFQYYKTRTITGKTGLAKYLADRHEAETSSGDKSTRGKTIGLKGRLDILRKRFPSLSEGYWIGLRELINYEKQFPDASAKAYRDKLREIRAGVQEMVYISLAASEGKRVTELNDAKSALDADSLKALSDEVVANIGKLYDGAIKSLRDIIEYGEMISDPQTPQIDLDGEIKTTNREAHETYLNRLTVFRSTRASLEAVKLAKHIDFLRCSEDTKQNIRRVLSTIDELTLRVHDRYPGVLVNGTPDSLPENERNGMLMFLAESYEFLAGECHWLAENFPKRHAQTVLLLGEILSGVGESLFKDLDRKSLQNVASESECKAFIDNLLGVEHIGPEEKDFDEETRGGEESIAVGEAGPSEAAKETASGPSVPSAKEEREIAAPTQEADRNREAKARQTKAINKDKRGLEKIEQKLAEKKEALERIKQSLDQGAHIRYLAWDLEDAPKKAAKFAQLAHRRALSIVEKLKGAEDISMSSGRGSEGRHRDEMAEYAGKAAEYEELQKHYESEGKALRIVKTKAFLGIEGMRKSSAAKRLLIELVDLEQDVESLNVTVCKTLPKYPPAKNRFGILETKDDQPLYDHVVEFRVWMEKVPEFFVHFHFRAPLPTGKTPDYYMEKMEIHDWNVQAVQKQETEEKVRSRQLEGGKKVLTALHAAWKKSLEINREKKKEVAPRASAAAASSTPAAPFGKQRKGKTRRK